MEREAREHATKEASPAPLSRNVQWLSLAPFFRAKEGEEKKARESFSNFCFSVQPPLQAPRERRRRGSRGRGGRNERREEGAKRQRGSDSSPRQHTTLSGAERSGVERRKCTIKSPGVPLPALRLSKNGTHSSVGGAGLEGPAPSAIVKRWRRGKGGL